ncbi:hypothetical protein KIJ00_00730 [Leuconostoc gelidum subsp. aenigmaticum]|uniref:hypothetical protein n=1 Tax=Leuconostoc gelidum TaxID=1244 RepID=UPI001CC7CD27|nr:hypothetical protein [Leuconostoc gelidum]MBZ6007789.1 hypothetical protein [Leuconostoc gelidum subsp. aenigmaticum]
MNKKFLKYRITVTIITIAVLIANLTMKLDQTITGTITMILPALIIFPFSYENYQDKKWLPFTAYFSVIVLSILLTIQNIYRFYILSH